MRSIRELLNTNLTSRWLSSEKEEALEYVVCAMGLALSSTGLLLGGLNAGSLYMSVPGVMGLSWLTFCVIRDVQARWSRNRQKVVK